MTTMAPNSGWWECTHLEQAGEKIGLGFLLLGSCERGLFFSYSRVGSRLLCLFLRKGHFPLRHARGGAERAGRTARRVGRRRTLGALGEPV